MYPGMARTSREEGFEEIADWFETLAKAEKSHAVSLKGRLTIIYKMLNISLINNIDGDNMQHKYNEHI